MNWKVWDAKKKEEAFIPRLCSLALCLAFRVLFFERLAFVLSLLPSLPVIPPSVLLRCSVPTFGTIRNSNGCHLQHYLLRLSPSQTQESEKRRMRWNSHEVCMLLPTFRSYKLLRVRSRYACRQLGNGLWKFDQTRGLTEHANPNSQFWERDGEMKVFKHLLWTGRRLRCGLWWQPLREVYICLS